MSRSSFHGSSSQKNASVFFQDVIGKLSNFWGDYGCVLAPTYDVQMGAGTSHPLTALYALGDFPWKTAFVQPSRRPADGRYGKNPNRFQKFLQFQVFLKPAPENPQSLLLASYDAIGLQTQHHDIRFVHDDWENPSLGAAGMGWEVWCDGMEITQFTYFQQMASIPCQQISVELTYGLERIAMILQGKENFFDILWNQEGTTYGELTRWVESQFSSWYLDEACIETIEKGFEGALKEGWNLLKKELFFPAYDCSISANHHLNMLDARGCLSPVQRAEYIKNIRDLVHQCGVQWINFLSKKNF